MRQAQTAALVTPNANRPADKQICGGGLRALKDLFIGLRPAGLVTGRRPKKMVERQQQSNSGEFMNQEPSDSTVDAVLARFDNAIAVWSEDCHANPSLWHRPNTNEFTGLLAHLLSTRKMERCAANTRWPVFIGWVCAVTLRNNTRQNIQS